MDEPSERDRLRLLEQVTDPHTITILESLPLSESSRCLEIGGGLGSIAYWLAGKFSRGDVVVVDIDTRHLDPQRFPNLTIQEDDITACDFPAASFDLVHARAVLCHLATRENILERAYQWISPEGWLVVEDIYTPPAGTSPYPAMNRYAAAAHHAATQRGADMQWGNKLPGIMAQLGFTQIAAQASPRLVGLGGLPDQLWRMNLQQAGSHLVQNGLLTAAELAELLRLLDDPAFTDIRYFGVTAWGQKPGTPN